MEGEEKIIMERQLASIQKVYNIRPIEGADKIVVCNILGWNVVIRKDEFKDGDLVVYCEVDSILPQKPEFEFLKDRGYRIKTIKLKKQISQGICFPLSVLPNGAYNEGDDVTELLGVTKYEIPIPAQLQGKVKGYFPGFIRKTDEIRIQSYPKLIDEMQGKPVYITTKIDGSSFTAYVKDGVFGVCSRNLELKEDDPDNFRNSFVSIAKKLNLKEKMLSLNNSIAIQGELAGVGIAKNKLNLKELDVYFFNAWDITNQKYLDFNDFVYTINSLGLKTVPIEHSDVEFNWKSVDELLELARGKYEGTNNHKEGIVIRPVVETYSDSLRGRMSFKVINNDFLLGED